MKNVIITGVNGFIGKNMCEFIKRSGVDIRIIGIDFDDQDSLVKIIKEDLTTVPLDRLASEVAKASLGSSIDAIIHLAAYKDLTESYKDPNTYYRNNIQSTTKIIDLAKLLNIKLILFSSSSAVYNDELTGAIKECDPHQGPSPYGYSKLACENILSDAARAYGIKVVNFRYCNPIGGYPGLVDTSTSMFGNIYNSLKSDSVFTIFGGNYSTPDGTPIRDYVSVFTIIKAHLYFLDHSDLIDQFDNINIGSGVPRSCLECCKLVQELCPDFKYTIGKARKGDAAGNYADISRLQSYGFTPEDDLSEVIKLILEDAVTRTAYDRS